MSLLSESATTPPEVQHQVPGKTQEFPYFWLCVYFINSQITIVAIHAFILT